MEYDYITDYNAFQAAFKKTETSGEDVGEFIMKMTGYYIKYNVMYGKALKDFSAVKANFQNQVDPTSGKATSSSKAEVLADATLEADIYEISRIHINNLEQIINSMKSLQKGVLLEYSNMK